MPLVSLSYRFTVLLPLPPEAAFHWATDFRPDDLALTGQTGTRTVEWIADDALFLTDTLRTPRGPVTKRRLVRLLPERLAWTNTHLSGPTRYSQYLYELTPVGRRRSRLTFTILQLERSARRPSAAARAARARTVAREDAHTWRTFARAMARDHAKRRAGGRPRSPPSSAGRRRSRLSVK